MDSFLANEVPPDIEHGRIHQDSRDRIVGSRYNSLWAPTQHIGTDYTLIHRVLDA